VGHASCRWQTLCWLFGTNPTISNRVYIKASFAWIARAFPITAAHGQSLSFQLPFVQESWSRSWSRWAEGLADSSHLFWLVMTVHYVNVEIICRNQEKCEERKMMLKRAIMQQRSRHILSLLWMGWALISLQFWTDSRLNSLILNPRWSGCTMRIYDVWIYC